MANETAPDCILIGGGGHAKVLIDTIQSTGQDLSLGIVDNRTELAGTHLLGVPILGPDERLAELRATGTRYFVVAVGTVGHGSRRDAIWQQALAAGLEPLDIRHLSAVVSPYARVGRGCQILAHAVVGPDTDLGDNVIINNGAVIEHDCRIGDHTHVATGALLCGSVVVGASSHIGAGSSVRQAVSVGRNAVVAMGAVVIADVPDQGRVGGVPARPLRPKAGPPFRT